MFMYIDIARLSLHIHLYKYVCIYTQNLVDTMCSSVYRVQNVYTVCIVYTEYIVYFIYNASQARFT